MIHKAVMHRKIFFISFPLTILIKLEPHDITNRKTRQYVSQIHDKKMKYYGKI